MLTEVRPGVVRSSEGFEVADLGVKFLVYQEGEHVLKFEKELGAYFDPGATYFLSHFPKWEPPHQDEPVSLAKRVEVIGRILGALDFRGDPYQTDLERHD